MKKPRLREVKSLVQGHTAGKWSSDSRPGLSDSWTHDPKPLVSSDLAWPLMLSMIWPPWKKSYDKYRCRIKKHRHHFANKGPSSQSYGFFGSHVWIWGWDQKEVWGPKNWCFWIVVLEKTLESPLDSKEINPVNCKGNSTLSIHCKDRHWSWSSNTLATWCEDLTHWKRP